MIPALHAPGSRMLPFRHIAAAFAARHACRLSA
jgi:hypothetical protein